MQNYRIIVNLWLIIIFVSLVIWLFSDIVLYFLISLVISTIIRPVTDYIDNLEVFGLKIPRILAVFFSFLILASIPIVFILLFVPLILEQITVLQNLDYRAILERIKQPIDSIDYFAVKNLDVNLERGFLLQDIERNVISVIEGTSVGPILRYLLSFTGKIFIYLLAISFITFFLLYEKGLIRKSFLAIVPNEYFELVVTTVYKIDVLLSNYLIGLLLQVTILFTIIASGLTIIDIKYALTIAAFAAFINLIPYLGPVLGFLFAVIVVFSTRTEDTTIQHYLFTILQTLPVFVLAQLIDNLLLQPIIFSKSVKAHPLEIFLIIFVGAGVAGGWGMIAAIPVYTIIRVSYIELTRGYQAYRIFRIREKQRMIEQMKQ